MKKLLMLQSPFLNSQDCLIWLQCLFCYDGSFQSQSTKSRAPKWFCRDTSGFGGKSLPAGPCHGKLPFFCIFGPHPFSVCQQEFLAVWPWAVGPVQTVLGTSCLTPPQQP